MDVISGEIDWYKIKTIEGFSNEYYDEAMRKMCLI